MFKSTPLLNMIECFDIDCEDKLNKVNVCYQK